MTHRDTQLWIAVGIALSMGLFSYWRGSTVGGELIANQIKSRREMNEALSVFSRTLLENNKGVQHFDQDFDAICRATRADCRGGIHAGIEYNRRSDNPTEQREER